MPAKVIGKVVSVLAIAGCRPIARGQAKRVLGQREPLDQPILNFEGVDSIGHSFADQVFRVFARANPEVQITVMNANSEVLKAIRSAQSGVGKSCPIKA